MHGGTASTFTFSDLPANFADSHAMAIRLLERVSFTEDEPIALTGACQCDDVSPPRL